ncbi:transcription factor bHLH96 [Tanacetum coccineum]
MYQGLIATSGVYTNVVNSGKIIFTLNGHSKKDLSTHLVLMTKQFAWQGSGTRNVIVRNDKKKMKNVQKKEKNMIITEMQKLMESQALDAKHQEQEKSQAPEPKRDLQSTQAWIKDLNYSLTHQWRSWKLHGQIAGYIETYSNMMTNATVKNRCSGVSPGDDHFKIESPVATVANTTVAAGRRKRRRTKSRKNKEELENQRMTHITVERNRRKQMNKYLAVIRSLMPSSYVQRV